MAYRKSCYLRLFRDQLKALSSHQIERYLDEGRKWNLTPALEQGGSLFFPHCFIESCGDQVAAAVHSSLDLGSDRVIALGVLHALSDVLPQARQHIFEGRDGSKYRHRGIFGSHFDSSSFLKTEHSLEVFRFLWDYEIKRRRLRHPPELILCYPFLVNKEPWKLPRLEKLICLAQDSAIIATGDFFHYGLAYGHSPDQSLPQVIKESLALQSIKKVLEPMQKQDYHTYQDYCFKSLSDPIDVGQMLMFLLGPLQGQVLDLRLVDTSLFYKKEPASSWVAASLIELTPYRLK